MNKKKLSTNLIRAGINRSKFMETSDPLFLTSGFIYESAEEAEKSFKEEKKRFMYSRFGNPTVEAFQKKMAILEEAEECWGTATGMAALFTILCLILKLVIELYQAKHFLEVVITLLPKFSQDLE